MKDIVRYLRVFRDRHPEIDSRFSMMLTDAVFNFYPSVERLLINHLTLEYVWEPGAVDACWTILEDRNRGIVRDFAARYVGRFSAAGDGARLRELFERESSEDVKRALLISYFESGACPQGLLTTLSRSSTRLGLTARYLNSSPTSIPCPDMEVRW
jgi:hypothetical protein